MLKNRLMRKKILKRNRKTPVEMTGLFLIGIKLALIL